MEWLKRYPIISALTFFVSVCIPLIAFFNVPFPRVAWASDIVRLEKQQLETAIDVHEDQLQRLKLRMYQNMNEQQKFKDAHNPVPGYLLEEQATLESAIKDVQAKLDQERQNLINEK